MKSFCIKNNNEVILNYLLTELEQINIDDVYISKNRFKHYKNIIVHYTGQNTELFIMLLSRILTNCVIDFYENRIIERIISSDYFYFTRNERDSIFINCEEILQNDNLKEFEDRKNNIFLSFNNYIKEHKFFILDGFVNFRLFEYKNILSDVVDIGVNKFIVDKEYKEFIHLLQSYINSQPSKVEIVHIVYSNLDPIILDENENLIVYNNQIMQPKYLSDISFSTNDYCLNELLNLLPQKIILHLITEEDEFTNTLQLIFSGRIIVCKECDICKIWEKGTVLNSHLK
jgi:putative sporulation protein YtxC